MNRLMERHISNVKLLYQMVGDSVVGVEDDNVVLSFCPQIRSLLVQRLFAYAFVEVSSHGKRFGIENWTFLSYVRVIIYWTRARYQGEKIMMENLMVMVMVGQEFVKITPFVRNMVLLVPIHQLVQVPIRQAALRLGNQVNI